MRDVLAGLVDGERKAGRAPHHAGLAYERYAPEKEGGEQGLDRWEQWLSWVEEAREPEGYNVAFARWREALRQAPTAWFTARAEGRVLVGHGNASPTGVGLTLHSSWGVPVIPGSSLKGVLAGYVRTVFGEHAMEDVCRRLFGAPGVEGTQAGAQAGEVIFHDALWVSQRKEDAAGPAMLARDVLTVHQKDWYGGEKVWPSDYDAPNPVAFLTVRPGSRFLVALSLAPGAGAEGDRLLRWAAQRLVEALRDWGVGRKTAAGYGRLEPEGAPEVLTPRPAVRRSPVRDAFLAWVSEQRGRKTSHKDVLDAFEAEWLGRLLELDPAGRQDCARELRGLMKKSPKHEARRDALLERLGC